MSLLGKAALAGGLAFSLSRFRPRFGLRGRSVLITGGSRGLGLELARLFAKEGARLTLCARNLPELEIAKREVQSLGGEALLVACDVSNADDAERAAREAVARFGSIDVLVNCAGIIQVAPDAALSLADYRQAMEINYFGALHFCRAAIPEMRRRAQGRIVNITSIGGAIAVPHLLPYSASKFALVGYSTGLRAELLGDGIRVVTVLPGLMRTGSFLNALFKGRADAEEAWFSVGASLPPLAMSSTRAARRIVLACDRGEAFLTLGLPFKALRVLSALMPGVTSSLLAAVNSFLPSAEGTQQDDPAEPGFAHRALEPRFLTRLGQRAARRNNEVPV